MQLMNTADRRAIGTQWIAALLLAVPVHAVADTVLTDFNDAAVASYNPRENWFAFGAGTTDSGVRSDGAIGRGAYHGVQWASSTFGIGEVSTVVVDLSGFDGVRVHARVVDVGGHTGTPLLRFALDLPGGTEWSTAATPLSDAYASYTFEFVTMTRTAGAGPLDLTAGKPKFIVEKNGQGGTARFDFDEVIGLVFGGPFELSPVTLRPPPDGDAVRAMWLYAFADDLRVDNAVDSQRILDFCAREGINRIYFGAFFVWTGGVELRDNLRTFLATARASGIRVEALIDGVEEYANPAFVQTRIDKILAFHDETPGDPLDDFDAVHFDIEFWLSSAWSSASGEIQRRDVARDYLDNVLLNARDHLDASGAGEIEVGADLSSHFDTSGMLPSPFAYGGSTQFFLEHALDLADDLTIMSYIDSAGGLLGWTGNELDMASGKGRSIVLGADIQPVPPELPINSFADDFTPTPFAAMSAALESFHLLLSPPRAGALAGFSVFHYDGYSFQAPVPRNVADLDGDGDADIVDYETLESLLAGPAVAADGLARDADLDLNGRVDLADYGLFVRCFTGPGAAGPLAAECMR